MRNHNQPQQGYYAQQQPVYVQQPPPRERSSCLGTCCKCLLCWCLIDTLCNVCC
ncbi:hypothetical protein KDRO_A04340 [Kluyveromyces lactis]|nr:hypothetical protein KDRO_A04340 [Kluyveromyces lactis]